MVYCWGFKFIEKIFPWMQACYESFLAREAHPRACYIFPVARAASFLCQGRSSGGKIGNLEIIFLDICFTVFFPSFTVTNTRKVGVG